MVAAEKEDTEVFTTTFSSKGQVVIPKGLRDRLGIRPGDVAEVVEEDGKLVLSVRRETLAEQKLRLFGPPVRPGDVVGILSHLAPPGPPLSMKEMRALAMADFGRRYREREAAQALEGGHLDEDDEK